MNFRLWLARPIRALAILLLVVTGLTACAPPATPFHATDVSGSSLTTDLALTDHHGQPRQLHDFLGKVVIVFFGYTQCPDVCPGNMNALRRVMDSLGPASKGVQVIFVTLDPERDTEELLAQYVPAFHADFLGLHGNAEQTARVAREMHIFYQKQPGRSATSYTLDHSTGSYVFDPKGQLRLYLRHGDAPENIADDVRRLLAGQ